VDAVFRYTPPGARAVILDLGVGGGVLKTTNDSIPPAFILRGAAGYHFGGDRGDWTAGFDFNAVFEKAWLEPTTWFVTVSLYLSPDAGARGRRRHGAKGSGCELPPLSNT